MKPEPLYTREYFKYKANLLYGWSGFFKKSRENTENIGDIILSSKQAWESDGISPLKTDCSLTGVSCLFKADPFIAPVTIASRAKGRIQYILRKNGITIDFQRNFALRGLGHNNSEDVKNYIARQTAKEGFVDERFQELLDKYSWVNQTANLNQPLFTKMGRYWYNLHLVLVVCDRYRISLEKNYQKIFDYSHRIAKNKGYNICAISVMPDHLHLALQGNLEHTPADIAMSFQSNIAYVMGQNLIWDYECYMGTFSEYNLGALFVRKG